MRERNDEDGERAWSSASIMMSNVILGKELQSNDQTGGNRHNVLTDIHTTALGGVTICVNGTRSVVAQTCK